MSETSTLKIWRGLDKAEGHWETHAVPFERGQSVLDGLRWIRVNKDPSLAIRFSCINANACKECMLELDGETVYACTARLEPREMTLAPLSDKPLVRDLVTEIAPPPEGFPVAAKRTAPARKPFRPKRPARGRDKNTDRRTRDAHATETGCLR